MPALSLPIYPLCFRWASAELARAACSADGTDLYRRVPPIPGMHRRGPDQVLEPVEAATALHGAGGEA